MNETDPLSHKRLASKDRRIQVVNEATRLFVESGFHSVRMEDIADATGVTARALYRHFPSKSSILSAAISESQKIYLSWLIAEHSREDTPLGSLIPKLVDRAVNAREHTVLWQREARYLTSEERRPVRDQINTIVRSLGHAIESEHSGLPPVQLELRAWGVSSTLTSLGNHHITLPDDEWIDILGPACRAAAHTGLVTEGEDWNLQPLPIGDSRHEKILAAAGEAFARRGFLSVTTEEIGSAVGIAGPAIYRYFPTKQVLLDTLVARYDEWAGLDHRRALRGKNGASEELRNLLNAHMRLTLDAPTLAVLLRTELRHVSDDVRDIVTRNRIDREGEWVAHVRLAAPHLTAAAAHTRALAAMSYIQDVVLTPRLWRGNAIAENTVAIALGILTGLSASSRNVNHITRRA